MRYIGHVSEADILNGYETEADYLFSDGGGSADADEEKTAWLEKRQEQEENCLDGTNEMVTVSRLDDYYSRNNIKTNLDDDED